MPEGHTIHRYARLHTAALAGRPLDAWSPQGRFATGAARLDGRVLSGVDAYGKHLFYRWQAGIVLHVHLGLFGTFRLHEGRAPAPSPETRLALRGTDPDVSVHLSGPTVCELLEPGDEEGLRARLGPDPLVDEWGLEVFAGRLRRRRSPIGQALLDQAAVAGVGNAFRAEGLFLCGLHPDRPARDLTAAEVEVLWQTLRRLLVDGEHSGRIHTVTESDGPGEPPARYVYRRGGSPCRRCAAVVRQWTLGGRQIYACPTCQPDDGAANSA